MPRDAFHLRDVDHGKVSLSREAHPTPPYLPELQETPTGLRARHKGNSIGFLETQAVGTLRLPDLERGHPVIPVALRSWHLALFLQALQELTALFFLACPLPVSMGWSSLRSTHSRSDQARSSRASLAASA